jgi:hypothetical protein
MSYYREGLSDYDYDYDYDYYHSGWHSLPTGYSVEYYVVHMVQ